VNRTRLNAFCSDTKPEQELNRTVSQETDTVNHANEKTTLLRRRRRRPLAGTNPASGRTAQSGRTAAGSLSLDAAGSNERHLRPSAEAKAPEAHVHFLNRIRFTAFLPDDCQDIDWELLPEQITARQREHTSAAAAPGQKVRAQRAQHHTGTHHRRKECIMSILSKLRNRIADLIDARSRMTSDSLPRPRVDSDKRQPSGRDRRLLDARRFDSASGTVRRA